MKRILSVVLVLLFHSVSGQVAQHYTSFEHAPLSLYAWQGNNVVLLSSSDTLDPATMNQWALKLDSAYDFYALCTGRQPHVNHGVTYLDSRATVAEVPKTCGAGCGYLGWTGIEIQDSYFRSMYAQIHNQNLYDQVPFYELGRNFWFYSDQLQYLENDPIVTGYAVFMRFMAMEASHVQGAPFGAWSFTEFRNNVINLLPAYLADEELDWSNTLGIGQGVPKSNLGATDLFASFCFYLKDNYGGNHWVENVWKYAGDRPKAETTEDAVDNFVIASSQAADTDLTSLFKDWKWPVSDKASSYIKSLNLMDK